MRHFARAFAFGLLIISRHDKVPIAFLEVNNVIWRELFLSLVQRAQKYRALLIIDFMASGRPLSPE
jgi:hypothetical protein